MPRHARVVDQRDRVIRRSTIAFVWLCGLAAGLYAVLAAAAKYGCVTGDQSMGCRTSGSVLGIVLLIAVIAVVALVTLTTTNRPARRVLVVGGCGVLALAFCGAAAAGLLSTT